MCFFFFFVCDDFDFVVVVVFLFCFVYDHLRPIIGTSPGKLRLIYVSEPVNAPSTPLSAEILSDLRIYTGSRIVYALTASKVAGAVSQTGIYDYRVDDGSEKYSHFGAPPPSVEIFLKDTKEYQTSDTFFVGQVYLPLSNLLLSSPPLLRVSTANLQQ